MRLIDVDAIPDIEFLVCDATSANGELDAYCRGMDKVMEVVKSMPPIEVPHWIPCSERLPEEAGMYLITEQNYGFKEDAFFKNELVHTSYFSVNKKEFQDTVYIPNCSNITAWMPLPEGYRGE